MFFGRNGKLPSLPVLLFLSVSLYGQIDRHALVTRNNVNLDGIDTLGALSVGNGEFAFTVDATGLQTFPEVYENGVPLGTQSQWGWHSFPNPDDYMLEDVLVEYETCNDHRFQVAIQHKDSSRAHAATDWLRVNPHRLHLGLIGLTLIREDGTEADIEALNNIDQELDLWSGKIVSRYEVEGTPVLVELLAHQEQDLISFRIESDLIPAGRLKVKFRFPYGADCHVCPGYDWDHPEKHSSEIIGQQSGATWLKRTLDTTNYYVGMNWSNKGSLWKAAPHEFELQPDRSFREFTCTVSFSPEQLSGGLPAFEEVAANSTSHWRKFWMEGGAIDFSDCTDSRAPELERRVVLSQYLTKIQCAGAYPPQETGLTNNSWYGKFHLEMHWWHGVHFALWNRIPLLEKSMGWYDDIMEEARKIAGRQGFAGVRWPKMTGPSGESSPSSVGEFLIWQQPHPIYFAELFYRQQPERATLERYRSIVFETADFMASFAQFNPEDGKYHLCAPLIPAQEIFKPGQTNDPPFELAYWHYALSVAQQWRTRLGMDPKKEWQEVIDGLVPLHQADGLYLPCADALTAYTDIENREDHPVVTGAYGMLPLTPLLKPEIMANTLEEIMKEWAWETTWGWDYPMLAMNAARLGKPETAIDALFLDTQKNTYLVNGHNYQDSRLRIYLPGNGGLLTAVAMMAAGWDGAPDKQNPGFPNNGKWNVKWENLEKMP
jgi:hypothetical protein